MTLNGYGLLQDGTSIALSVADLSYDGCRIETGLALLPGLTMRISIRGLGGGLDAVVRWCKGGSAGLQFTPPETAVKVQTPRAFERSDLAAEISVRRVGKQHALTRMFNLSRAGCRVSFVDQPVIGETVWIKLPDLEAVQARVCWADESGGGVEFLRPIHPAVFDLLLKRLGG